MAGRLIDGFQIWIDGRAPVWRSPRWLEALQSRGYDSSVDGPVAFVVTDIHVGELRRFSDLRAALRYGRARLERRRLPVHPDSLAIDCRTPTGLIEPVVWGRALLGMARGALDAEPITALSGPAVLPGRPDRPS
jgi:hypothetical protein